MQLWRTSKRLYRFVEIKKANFPIWSNLFKTNTLDLSINHIRMFRFFYQLVYIIVKSI